MHLVMEPLVCGWMVFYVPWQLKQVWVDVLVAIVKVGGVNKLVAGLAVPCTSQNRLELTSRSCGAFKLNSWTHNNKYTAHKTVRTIFLTCLMFGCSAVVPASAAIDIIAHRIQSCTMYIIDFNLYHSRYLDTSKYLHFTHLTFQTFICIPSKIIVPVVTVNLIWWEWRWYLLKCRNVVKLFGNSMKSPAINWYIFVETLTVRPI